jgi:hypothetical protein
MEAMERNTPGILAEEVQSLVTTIIGATDEIRFHHEKAVVTVDDPWAHLVRWVTRDTDLTHDVETGTITEGLAVQVVM